jgi:hypothetical protein
VERALRHQEPDRTPIFEYVLLPPLAERFLGRRSKDYAGDGAGWNAMAGEIGWEKAVRQYVADRLDVTELLGHDMLYVCPSPPPPDVIRRGEAEQEERERRDPPPVDDPVAAIRRRVADAEERPSGPNPQSLLVYELLQHEMKRRGLDLPILAPAYAHGVWTDTDLMMCMAIDPETAHAHFRSATRRSLAHVEAYLRHGITQIGVGGDFAGNRTLISPADYHTFIMPEVRAVARRIHEAGCWAVNASDGDLWPVIDDFLLGCEVDGYLEIEMRAGMDMKRLKERFGSRITFYGNMDCGTILSFWPEEEVRRVTRESLRDGWGKGGHIFCTSNAITESVTLDRYLAMVAEYRSFFGLPAFSPPAL